MSISFILYAGLICYSIYYLIKTEYIVFRSDVGEIHIIKSKNHAEIVEEITKRRNEQILRLYGEVDLSNDLASEIEKYKILLSEDIINEAQYEEYKKKIEQELARKNVSGFNSSLN